MTTQEKIENHLRSLLDDNAKYVRDKGYFQDILNDKTIASIGMSNGVISYLGRKIVWLHFSPVSYGKPAVIRYDYVTDKRYERVKDAHTII